MTETIFTSITIPPCSAQSHSHWPNPHGAGNSLVCHGHSCFWYNSGSYIAGHASWLGVVCTATTTTITTPLTCLSGRHSHTGDGRNCRSHNFVATTCGASYQRINGNGHSTHTVRSVPPCTRITDTTTTTTPSGCLSGRHSHTGDGRSCHRHNFVATTCGAAYQTINGNGHHNHRVRSVPPCTGTTTTTTTPLSCSTGLHSHTGDGRSCHSHNFVPTTCGAAYQTINGNGHHNHTVRSVPPCTGTTTTTTVAVDCAEQIEADITGLGGLQIIIGNVNAVVMPTGTRWQQDMW